MSKDLDEEAFKLALDRLNDARVRSREFILVTQAPHSRVTPFEVTYVSTSSDSSELLVKGMKTIKHQQFNKKRASDA